MQSKNTLSIRRVLFVIDNDLLSPVALHQYRTQEREILGFLLPFGRRKLLLKIANNARRTNNTYIFLTVCAAFFCLLSPTQSFAGAQIYEPLSDSVRGALSSAIADQAPPKNSFQNVIEGVNWLAEMSRRLEKRMPNRAHRLEFLRTVHYEATRAGLDPQLVLGLIQVESGFKKYVVSSAGARGFMQIMPFWAKLIGQKDDNLFHLRTNIRYGCLILRHYLDIEKGDLYRALGRYNGSLGKAEYPNLVRGAWHGQWLYVAEKADLEVPEKAQIKTHIQAQTQAPEAIKSQSATPILPVKK